jgi:tetratricopeptide (TPR) repeat protein
VPISHRALDLDRSPVFTPGPGDPLAEPEEVPRQEIESRAALAIEISKAGAQTLPGGSAAIFGPTGRARAPETPACIPTLNIAGIELGKVLKLDPEHIRARMTRMTQSLAQGHFEQAKSDLELLLASPRLTDQRMSFEQFTFLYKAAERFAHHGLIDEALKLADKAVDLSDEEKVGRGRSLYFKAVVLSYAAQSDRTQIEAAARQLQLAFLANSRFERWYQDDPAFDPVRISIDAALLQLPDARYVQ